MNLIGRRFCLYRVSHTSNSVFSHSCRWVGPAAVWWADIYFRRHLHFLPMLYDPRAVLSNPVNYNVTPAFQSQATCIITGATSQPLATGNCPPSPPPPLPPSPPPPILPSSPLPKRLSLAFPYATCSQCLNLKRHARNAAIVAAASSCNA